MIEQLEKRVEQLETALRLARTTPSMQATSNLIINLIREIEHLRKRQ